MTVLTLPSLGPVALATQSVLLVSASTAYNAPFALSVSAAVRIGNLLGEENARRAGIASNASLLIALVIAGFNRHVCLPCFTLRRAKEYLKHDFPRLPQVLGIPLQRRRRCCCSCCLDPPACRTIPGWRWPKRVRRWYLACAGQAGHGRTTQSERVLRDWYTLWSMAHVLARLGAVWPVGRSDGCACVHVCCWRVVVRAHRLAA